jgi:L-histidine N-alpha-methyltransferase
MNRNDLFVYSLKLDSDAARRYFDFGIDANRSALNIKSRMVLDMLNLDESFYGVEMGFDQERRERYTRIRLKIALTIHFELENGERSVVFNKNDTILLWRSWHQSVRDVIGQLERNDFDVLQTSLTEDKEYLLTVSRVKSES